MSTFWLVYWISLGITVIFSLFVYLFFETNDYSKKGPIQIAYVILSIMVAAIPGAGILFTALLIIGIICFVADGALVAKKHPFGESDDE